MEPKAPLVEIDGSHGEGGGQILRTGLTLALLTGRPLRIFNIRSGRKSSGLKPQHLMAVRASAEISGGQLQGDVLGGTELRFEPGPIRPGRYLFDVAALAASAGSVGLIFQTLLLPLASARTSSHLLLQGGTHVAWSPSVDYLRTVFLPTIAPMGIRADLNLLRWGFYPIGGGGVEADVGPAPFPLHPLRIETRGELRRIEVISVVANLPVSIGRRQLDRALARLREAGYPAQGEVRTAASPGKGTFCFIRAEFEKVRAGFPALGEIGKRAEAVADEAADAFLRYQAEVGALDPHLGDQVVLPMALAGGESRVTVSEFTEHLRTNLWVIERFLPGRFSVEGEVEGKGGTIRAR
ncbi:MAG: RNA 3'-phosphate cyclase [Nitrospirae bacterium]|nr:RNA 3'-phosphate cyclase [Nitrospirota bacterium]